MYIIFLVTYISISKIVRAGTSVMPIFCVTLTEISIIIYPIIENMILPNKARNIGNIDVISRALFRFSLCSIWISNSLLGYLNMPQINKFSCFLKLASPSKIYQSIIVLLHYFSPSYAPNFRKFLNPFITNKVSPCVNYFKKIAEQCCVGVSNREQILLMISSIGMT